LDSNRTKPTVGMMENAEWEDKPNSSEMTQEWVPR
jgi:hypothetical protein